MRGLEHHLHGGMELRPGWDTHSIDWAGTGWIHIMASTKQD